MIIIEPKLHKLIPIPELKKYFLDRNISKLNGTQNNVNKITIFKLNN